MKVLQFIGISIDFISEWLGRIASYFIFLLVIVVSIHVIMRYIFGKPTIWAWDINTYLFFGIVFLGAGYHLLHRYIITVDVLYDRFPSWLKKISITISILVTTIFCVVLIWKGSESAWRAIQIKEMSGSVFAPPIYPLRALIPLGAFMLLIQYIRNAIKDFNLKKREEEI